MPYIHQSERDILDTIKAMSPGQLNYLITRQVRNYLGAAYSYRDLNEVIGVLECVKLELYRRVAAPYEDKKMKENGDVY